MPTVGAFNDPFPFPPYPMQSDAVTRLRRFLLRQNGMDGNANNNGDGNNYIGGTAKPSTSTSTSTSFQPSLAVLESPTGTGKSHMLLASVLSDLFTPVYSLKENETIDSGSSSKINYGEYYESVSALQQQQQQEQQCHSSPPPTAAPSLEDALRQRRYEEVERLTSERVERVKAARRRMRIARKKKELMLRNNNMNSSSYLGDRGQKRNRDGNENKDDDVNHDGSFLVDQNPLDFLEESSGGDNAFSFSFTSSSSSSDSSGGDDDDGDGDEEGRDEEASVLSRLASLVPLRTPKAYIASRTHTQIAQLFQDLVTTEFVKNPIVTNKHGGDRVVSQSLFNPRHHHQHHNSSGINMSSSDTTMNASRARATAVATTTANKEEVEEEETEDAEAPRALHAVHLAGRQQLCINTALRRASGGRGEALNNLCLSAMKFENSSAGRKARRAANAQRAAAGLAHQQESSSLSLLLSSSRMGVWSSRSGGGGGDMEDLAGHPYLSLSSTAAAAAADKGCAYCASSRLAAMLELLQQRQQPTTTSKETVKRTTTNSDSISNKKMCDALSSPPESFAQPLSLEAMRALGSELGACPYLASRLLVRGADVVFTPYGYLASEEMRNGLLGGVATNPVTAGEEALVRRHRHHRRRSNSNGSDNDSNKQQGDGGVGSESNRTDDYINNNEEQEQQPEFSLTAVLHSRRARAVAATASWSIKNNNRARRNTTSNTGADGGIGNQSRTNVSTATGGDDHHHHVDDATAALEAAHRPPNFSGAVIVLDEAHNLVDLCRTVSTAAITVAELTLVRAVMTGYLKRFESRLLTKNKQRLREMALFAERLIAYCCCRDSGGRVDATGGPQYKQQQQQSTAVVVSIDPFSSFIFDAGIDHIDVFPFLVFLVDCRLAVKVLGLVPFTLRQESAALAAFHEAQQNAAREAQVERARRRQRTTPGNKNINNSDALNASGTGMNAYPQPPPPPPPTSAAATADSSSHPSMPFTELFSSLLGSTTTATATTTAAATVNEEAAVSATSQAMQRFDSLLRAFYISDSSSSSISGNGISISTARVIIEDTQDPTATTASVNASSSLTCSKTAPPTTPAAAAAARLGRGLKVIQLEPGRHTLGPLFRQAKGVILAGGTMQPLALSCGLLVPPPRQTTSTSTSINDSSISNGNDAGVTLISEPHVVPASAISVWALPCGPSGRRLEFSHQALSGGGGVGGGYDKTSSPSPSPTSITAAASLPAATAAAFEELAAALVNFARVLPPAGVICFFTSYEMERRFTDFLVRRGLFDDINAVKKIFRESSSSPSSPSGTMDRSGGGGGGVAQPPQSVEAMLDEYKRWIYGEGGDGLAASSPASTKATTASPSSTPVTAQGGCTPIKRRRRRGALLFAVMGGKLSEGINFADDLGRAVIVVGLPYANLSDGELRLFLGHVASTRVRRSNSSNTNTTTTNIAPSDAAMSKEEWDLYTDMCMRTVNQCVGRCIRHIHDHAAVILLDARYAERPQVRRRLSGWMLPSLKVAAGFGDCFRGLRAFFHGQEQQQKQLQQQN